MTDDKNLSEANKAAGELYQKLFGRFDEPIKELKTLYIAPDSFLNLAAFERLVLPDNTYLVERQEIRQILTGRELLYEQKESAPDSLLAYGGIDFNNFPKTKAPGKKQQKQLWVEAPQEMTLALLRSDEISGNGFNLLPESEKEAKAIVFYYKQARKAPAEAITGAKASESALKGITKPPRVLHLSTHGFYRDNNVQLQGWTKDKALVLSGLTLAGANLGLKGRKALSGEDGILYSLEIAGLNLNGTDLVTLSACETGVGALDYSDGVYGVIRAFKIAGAKSVLMTLRSVSDSQSKNFMIEFYKKWVNQPKGKSDPLKALRETKLHYIKHENKELRKPSVWSPYVMVG